MKPEQLSHLETLFVRYFEGQLQKEEIDYLNATLLNDSKAQDFYFDYLKTFLALKQSRLFSLDKGRDCSDYQQILEEMGQYEKNAAVVEIEKPKLPPERVERMQPPKAVSRVSRLALYTTICSSAALIFLVLLARFAPPRQETPLAYLERSINAQWENVSGKISQGNWLGAGPMKLVSGYVELTMRDGASVFMQAPVEFTLESSHQIFLQNGRLTASLNNQTAGTFVVRSPYGSVVDYGTEFGVHVGSSGATETYVFKGKVQLRDSSDPLRFNDSMFIHEGEGAAAELSGGILEISPAKVDAHQFVRSEEMILRDQAAQGSSYHRWQAYRYTVGRDPALVAYYRCEQDGADPDKFVNSAPATGEALSVGLGSPDRGDSKPSWTEGRWPQTTALRFDRTLKQIIHVPDHPRLRMAGPITMAAWIKLPGDQESQGGLILSHRTLNEINYQLVLGKRPSLDKMVLAFGRYGTHLDPKVHSGFVDLQPETWHHLAVTHDNSTVQYYIDGKVMATSPHVFRQDPVAADLYIGFTPVAESAGFNGVLGELMLFDRAMSEQEILGMYSQTKP